MAQTIETKLGTASGAAPTPHGALAKIRRIVFKPLVLLVEWQERAEQRQILGSLDDRMLKDIGISASDAYRESRKPFWLA